MYGEDDEEFLVKTDMKKVLNAEAHESSGMKSPEVERRWMSGSSLWLITFQNLRGLLESNPGNVVLKKKRLDLATALECILAADR